MRTDILRLMIVPLVVVGFQLGVFAGGSSSTEVHRPRSAQAIAAEVDKVILSELEKGGVKAAERCNDEDFLRRASLDIAGQLPTPAEIKAFRADSSPDKRAAMIDKLIESSEFGKNWARYWRDVIYLRATEQRSRFNQEEFTDWMADQWNKGTGWNSTVTSILTALGNVEEHPETALIFAQGASAEDVAAESCRIFLGIQLQCANCHDHPSDIWKREQFHQLAAYFPRISERREMKGKPEFEIVSVNTDRRPGEFMHEHPELFVRSMDRNQDQKLSKEEMLSGPKFRGKTAARRKKMGTDSMQEEMQPKMSEGMQANKGNKLNPKLIDRLFAAGDTDKDGLLSVEEIKTMPQPDNKRKGSAEHLMADLKHPESPGTAIDPKFFVDGSTLSHGLSDEERRKAAAKAFTSADNPWFARAIVNRVWAEMLGEGFYMPVDDLGPNRSARYPEAMELICASFVANNYDPKWLVRTVANTDAYQRKIQTKTGAEGEMPFASATPVTLRSDVIFNSLMGVIGAPESKMGTRPRKKGEMKESPRAFLQSPRFLFDALFGVDPSVPKDEVTGNIPQSLLMMNSRVFRTGTSAKGEGRLAKIVSEHKDNHEAIREVYLLVLAREPSASEIEICMNYLADVKSRGEAFEDLMWSLLNSTEFLSRR